VWPIVSVSVTVLSTVTSHCAWTTKLMPNIDNWLGG
jgi:hypothetical protein